MKLPSEEFAALIKNGILPSLDLIIKNEKDEVLLGQRKNDPAKGYWFVPGGRIYKNESFQEALDRISHSEVGDLRPSYSSKMIGIFNHIYKSNFFGDRDYNTHYLAIGIELNLKDIKMRDAMDHQHDGFKFMSISALVKDESVHDYTRYYFTENPPNRFL